MMPQPPARLIIARQSEVGARINAARVVGDRSGPGLKFIFGDGIRVVAIGTARDRALRQRQCLADDQLGIDVGGRQQLREGLNLRQHEICVRGAIAPAIVVVDGQALKEARIRAAGTRCGRSRGRVGDRVAGYERRAPGEVNFRYRSRIGGQNLRIREKGRLLGSTGSRRMAAGAIDAGYRIDRVLVVGRGGREEFKLWPTDSTGGAVNAPASPRTLRWRPPSW